MMHPNRRAARRKKQLAHGGVDVVEIVDVEEAEAVEEVEIRLPLCRTRIPSKWPDAHNTPSPIEVLYS